MKQKELEKRLNYIERNDTIDFWVLSILIIILGIFLIIKIQIISNELSQVPHKVCINETNSWIYYNTTIEEITSNSTIATNKYILCEFDGICKIAERKIKEVCTWE